MGTDFKLISNITTRILCNDINLFFFFFLRSKTFTSFHKFFLLIIIIIYLKTSRVVKKKNVYINLFQNEINFTQNFLRFIQLDINMYKQMNEVTKKIQEVSLHVVTS